MTLEFLAWYHTHVNAPSAALGWAGCAGDVTQARPVSAGRFLRSLWLLFEDTGCAQELLTVLWTGRGSRAKLSNPQKHHRGLDWPKCHQSVSLNQLLPWTVLYRGGKNPSYENDGCLETVLMSLQQPANLAVTSLTPWQSMEQFQDFNLWSSCESSAGRQISLQISARMLRSSDHI